MSIEQAFGVVLRRERNRVKLSQEELAHLSNLDRTFISLLERGLRQPSLNSIFSIANTLNVSADILVKMTLEIMDENT
jgi:transcriptional regulator with XRE-family HTH domain